MAEFLAGIEIDVGGRSHGNEHGIDAIQDLADALKTGREPELSARKALQASRGRRYGPGTARLAYRLAAALCATNLALLAGLVLLLTSGQQLLFGLPPFTGVIRGLAWLSLALALPVAVLALRASRRQDVPSQVRLSLLLVAGTGLVLAGMLPRVLADDPEPDRFLLPAELVDHVVEEGQAGRHRGGAGAVEIEGDLDRGLRGDPAAPRPRPRRPSSPPRRGG